MRGRVVVVVATAFLPVIIRLLVLSWFPPPYPRVQDEFSHLLVAETLSSGRLANPPHRLSHQLETAYVVQAPTYSSVYPLGQGSILAVGNLLAGHPWAGVLLSVALMSGGISWLLFGYLPAGWAAVGGVLAALQFGLAAPWINSYWGGAWCAFGGALLFGALARLRRQPSNAMGITAGLGWSIICLTRPFESVVPFLFTWLAFAVFVYSHRGRWRSWVTPVVLCASVQMMAGAITLLHNHAVTGTFETLPYQLDQRGHGTPQSFLGQRAFAAPDVQIPELQSLYEWQRKQKDDLEEHPFRQAWYVVKESWRFYVTPWYSLPMLMLIFLVSDVEVVVGIALVACALATSSLYPFFLMHYVAAYAGVVFLLIMRGMIRLSSMGTRHVPLGRAASALLIIGGALATLPFSPIATAHGMAAIAPEPPGLRQQLVQRLNALGGRHVEFVQYGPGHSFHDEWVYNAANIDDAPIVWCRSLSDAEDDEARRYYGDRQTWQVVVDDGVAQVSRDEEGGEASGVAFTLRR